VPDDVTIQVLTQARGELIRRTFEALRGARRAVVHFYNATAPVMRRVVLGTDEDGIVELAASHARLIRELAEAQPETEFVFEYSPEMFSGTELAVREGAWSTRSPRCGSRRPSASASSTCPRRSSTPRPNIFADMIEWMHRHLARRDSIVLSVHPHNDRGTGTAAGEFALMAGADRIEGCLFGNGERTGNVDLVNIALNLYTQGCRRASDFSDIDDVRRCVEHCNQLPVHPAPPVRGRPGLHLVLGSHQDAIKKAFAARRDGDVWRCPTCRSTRRTWAAATTR
jgi:2-isopropylmalate synthase